MIFYSHDENFPYQTDPFAIVELQNLSTVFPRTTKFHLISAANIVLKVRLDFIGGRGLHSHVAV